MDDFSSGDWENKVDRQIRELVGVLVAERESFGSARAAASGQVARRELAETLNQAIRRVRQTESPAALFALLVEATAPFARCAAVFRFVENTARAEAQRNVGAETLTFPASDAAAFIEAIETREPVVAAATPGEISSFLAGVVDGGSPSKVHLFPLVASAQVTAVLFAAEAGQPAALELLSEAAGMRLETLSGPAPKPVEAKPELVQIEGRSTAAKSWNELSPEDQKFHLRAQRVALVKISELRLSAGDRLRQGIQAADIYSLMKPELDRLRASFREEFLAHSPTMVDYLHLELVRLLANHDERLLGPHYPGPLV